MESTGSYIFRAMCSSSGTNRVLDIGSHIPSNTTTDISCSDVVFSETNKSSEKDTKDNPFIYLPVGEYALFLSELPMYDRTDSYYSSSSDLKEILVLSLPSILEKKESLSFSNSTEGNGSTIEINALALYRVESSYILEESAQHFVNPILGVEDDSDSMILFRGTTESGFDFILFLLDEESRINRMEELNTDYNHYGRMCSRIDERHVLTFEIISYDKQYFREAVEGLSKIDWYIE